MGSGADFMDEVKGQSDVETTPTETALSKQVGGGHYKDMVIQPIEYCHHNRLGACESAVIKYVTRHGSKNGKQDLMKAIHCIELLIEMEYGDE